MGAEQHHHEKAEVQEDQHGEHRPQFTDQGLIVQSAEREQEYRCEGKDKDHRDHGADGGGRRGAAHRHAMMLEIPDLRKAAPGGHGRHIGEKQVDEHQPENRREGQAVPQRPQGEMQP